jgi:drug/metabolite transporter (DMT)-like permease
MQPADDRALRSSKTTGTAASDRALLPVHAPMVGTWLALILLGVIPTLVGHTLVQVAARTAPPTIVALTSPGETVGSLAIGAALLRKWPTPIEGIGTAIILAGAVVAIRGAAASSASSASRTEG